MIIRTLRNTQAMALLYAVVLIAGIGSEIAGSTALGNSCRPLLMVLLSLWFFFNSRRYGDRFTVLVQAGIFFALLGDIALLFSYRNDFNFLVSLSASGLGLLCYGVALLNNLMQTPARQGFRLPMLAIPAVLLAAWWGSKDMLDMIDPLLRLPISLYACVLALAVVLALLRSGHTYRDSFYLVLIGAALLLVSDGLLTHERYVGRVPLAPLLITGSYALGQGLLVFGALRHVRNPRMVTARA